MRITYKLLTTIANSDLSDEAKHLLGEQVQSLSEAEAGGLAGAFAKYPQALTAYAEYIAELKATGGSLTPAQLETILKNIFEKLPNP